MLGIMLVVFLVFGETFIVFSIVAAPIYILTNRIGGSLFSTSLPTFVICVLFDDSYSDRCGVISHCGSDLHFPDD